MDPSAVIVTTQPPISDPHVTDVTTQPPISDPHVIDVTTQPPISDPHVTAVTTQPPISDPHVTAVTTQPPISDPHVTAVTQLSLSDQQSPVPNPAVTNGQGQDTEKKSDTFLQRMKNADTMGEKFSEVKSSMTHGAQKIGRMIDDKIRSFNAHKDPQMTMLPAEGPPVAQTPAVVQAQTLQSLQSPVIAQPQVGYTQYPMETKNQAATMATTPQAIHPQGLAVVQPQDISPQLMAAPYHQFQSQGPGMVIVSGSLGDQPSVTVCPNCGRRVMTRVVYRSGPFSWLMCTTCMIFGLVLGCCVIPFFMDSFKDAHHFCPDCGNPLHVHKRM
ncbi:uncharacterized protein LOC134081501 [Sardina pilchardus]|uniref:uncharacterized protein LOC134081501 n=1 Tax=Sardina pilchardus TaxID=27697 RepID=UPI002E13793E